MDMLYLSFSIVLEWPPPVRFPWCLGGILPQRTPGPPQIPSAPSLRPLTCGPSVQQRLRHWPGWSSLKTRYNSPYDWLIGQAIKILIPCYIANNVLFGFHVKRTFHDFHTKTLLSSLIHTKCNYLSQFLFEIFFLKHQTWKWSHKNFMWNFLSWNSCNCSFW